MTALKINKNEGERRTGINNINEGVDELNKKYHNLESSKITQLQGELGRLNREIIRIKMLKVGQKKKSQS